MLEFHLLCTSVIYSGNPAAESEVSTETETDRRAVLRPSHQNHNKSKMKI